MAPGFRLRDDTVPFSAAQDGASEEWLASIVRHLPSDLLDAIHSAQSAVLLLTSERVKSARRLRMLDFPLAGLGGGGSDNDDDSGQPWLSQYLDDEEELAQLGGSGFGVSCHSYDPRSRARTSYYANQAYQTLVNLPAAELASRVERHDLLDHFAPLDFLCLMIQSLYASLSPDQHCFEYFRWQWPGDGRACASASAGSGSIPC